MLPLLLTALASAQPPADAVVLPATDFTMGSPRQPDEQPEHPVTVPAFAMDRREVRLGDYRAFAPGGTGAGPDHPVVGVRYEEAARYCAAKGGRLPSEEEWERACKASSGGPYPWGEGTDRPAVWWEEERYGKYGLLPGLATRAEPDPTTLSPEGVAELAGSVWEWTATPYDRDAYQHPGEPAPDSPWVVIRGGSYANLPSYATCTHREPARPDEPRLTLGFRCVYDPDPAP